MATRITSVAVDCSDPELLAGFWAQVLDWVVTDREPGEGVSIGPMGGGPISIDFMVVPDGAKTGKNRLHLDLNATDRDQDAELTRLVDLGAKEIDIGQGDVSWHVLADPEGNEFCLLRRRVAPA